MFYINSLALIFSERHLNLKTNILTSFFFRGVLTSRSHLTTVCLFSVLNADMLTTMQDSCMELSVFVQHSLMGMYVKSEKHIFVINAGFLMTRHNVIYIF